MDDDTGKSKLSLPEIKKRLKSSFVSLFARQILLRAIGFISINIVLARLLSVETLGIFNIATAIVSFFAFFSDIGLAASLIQKKEDIEYSDIKTTFTIQQIIVGFLSLIIIFGAPYLGNFYSLNDSGIWLIRVLGISFFLSSLKVIPSVMLERQLKFNPLVFVEVLETVIFNGVLIAAVLAKFDIWSFSIAILARGVVGVIVIYILAPTKIGFGIDKISAKKLLSFGVPYQVNNLLALTKDRLVPLVIARLVGPTGIGYITWAQAIAFLPLEIMNVIIRITFPAFSRLQDDKESLSIAVDKSLFLTALFVYPALFGLGAILPSVVTFVVSSKWQPAMSSFYLFAFSTYWAVISTTLTNTLNATGHIKQTLKLMIMWTVLTWILTPVLTYYYGYLGVGIASFIISFSSVMTIILVKRILPIKVMEAIILPTGAAILMAGLMYLFSENFVRSKLSLIPTIILGALIYIGVVYLFGKDRIIKDIKALKNV
ncbi:oligosaccharide flippase family protein [Candidatus Daviesbacteria bacterium]|nr:oligosaccharide flippase family protein [Candidatus Daviesbacteria bacterium]